MSALLVALLLAPPTPASQKMDAVVADLGGPPRVLYPQLLAKVVREHVTLPRGEKQAVRLHLRLDAEGRITSVVGHDGGDPALVGTMASRVEAKFGPKGDARLPVPTDPKLRAAVLGQGVVVTLQPPPAAAQMPLPNELKTPNTPPDESKER